MIDGVNRDGVPTQKLRMKCSIQTAILVAAATISLLSGCQTASDVRYERGNRVASVFGDYIICNGRLPSGQGDLIAYAYRFGDRTTIRRLQNVSFQALGPSTARVEFSDSHGVRDYRNVSLSAPYPLQLTNGADALRLP